MVGRQSEMAQIVVLFDDPPCQLLTLIGPGGIGKTRLALEVARHELEHFADGVWFEPLAPLTVPEQIAATIGTFLGFKPSGVLALESVIVCLH